MIDFTQLGINSIQKQINPRDIFMALTGKDNKYQYPRDVQGEVWKQWFNVRQNKDTIIKMNTGSGKTLVALLILQSCLNEGVGPALYVVPDKFLVEQVKTQADALGIKVTDTENDLDYQRKKAILVIGIQKLVNGKSIFGLREENNYPIGSVVIDDMHACISCIQEQFSITVPRTNVLYNLIANLFYDDMNAQAEGRFNEIVNSQNTFDNMMVPFWSWQEKITQVYQILASNRENDAVKFKFDLIKDCLKLSHCYISAKEISIIPNCTPIQKITSFDEAKRRIYMSATLPDDSPFSTVMGLDFDKKMTVIEALFLGLIQGITEFLPISSSAHLIIFRHFMKIEDTQTVFFNVLLHFGSMIAILLTFSKEWKRLFLALCGIIIDLFHNLKEHFSSQHQEGKQYRKVLGSNYRMLAFLLILTTIPTAVIGGMIQSLVTLTSSNLLAPGVGLYLTAILLVVADMLPEGEKTQKNLKPKDALIAGFFQGFSTIPGLSRLGSTISACVIGGMTRSYAVKYSLIVSVPAIIGATIVELATMGKNKIVFHPVYLVGVFMAALAGYFTIRILMRVVKKRKLKYFALYCLLVGTFSIAGYFLL